MKQIATVVNNNQPGWQNIIETEPHVTLDVGTKLYLVDESTGVGLIAIERLEQLEKHGFDDAHDDQNNNGELRKAAEFLLTEFERTSPYHTHLFPETWDKIWMDKMHAKPRIEKLAIIGALLAAEIDRLQRQGS